MDQQFSDRQHGIADACLSCQVSGCWLWRDVVGGAAVARKSDECQPRIGHGYGASLRLIILPLLKSSFVAGLMLVFVDIMKELPMTLLLRPFDFETLATHTYQFAKDEMLEQAALPALMILLTGLIPVILMSAMLRRYR